MKTNGQILYEHKHPDMIYVVPYQGHKFATIADVLYVKNPKEPTPWQFLTKLTQVGWEKTAIGHNLFSKCRT